MCVFGTTTDKPECFLSTICIISLLGPARRGRQLRHAGMALISQSFKTCDYIHGHDMQWVTAGT